MCVSLTCFLSFVIIPSLHLPSSLCSLTPLCSFALLLLRSSCFPPLPRESLGTERHYGLLKSFWTEASLCICHSGCFSLLLFGETWDVMRSLQRPKKLSDPRMTLIREYTLLHRLKQSSNAQQQSHRHASGGQENFCCLFGVNPPAKS